MLSRTCFYGTLYIISMRLCELLTAVEMVAPIEIELRYEIVAAWGEVLSAAEMMASFYLDMEV